MTLPFLLGLSALMFLSLLFLHFILLRLTPTERFMGASLKTLFVALVVFTPTAYFVFGFSPFEIFVCVFFLVGFWNMFLIFMANLTNSFSLRMVDEILQSPQQKLSKEQLDEIFSDEHSFRLRLEAMERNGLLHWDRGNDRVQLLKKGKIYARFFGGFRRLFRIRVVG